MKRDMEELKKDVESVKALTGEKSFLENIADMNQLKKKAVSMHHDDSFGPQKWGALGGFAYLFVSFRWLLFRRLNWNYLLCSEDFRNRIQA